MTAALGGHLDCTALPLPLLTVVEECFALVDIVLPPRLRLWIEVTEGADTVVEPLAWTPALLICIELAALERDFYSLYKTHRTHLFMTPHESCYHQK